MCIIVLIICVRRRKTAQFHKLLEFECYYGDLKHKYKKKVTELITDNNK